MNDAKMCVTTDHNKQLVCNPTEASNEMTNLVRILYSFNNPFLFHCQEIKKSHYKTLVGILSFI